MIFRVTPYSIANSAIMHQQSHMSILARLQTQASSGLKYARASDAPLATDKIRQLHRDLQALEAAEVQFSNAEHRLNSGVSTLLDMQNLLVRAKQIALDASQTADIGARETLATEVDALLKQMVTFANTQIGDDFIFAGTATDTRPVEMLEDNDLAIPFARYLGADERAVLALAPSILVDTYYQGSELFFNRDRSGTMLFGDTGLQTGTGTDSGIGRAVIQVTHDTTTFQAGSGVAAGTSSAQLDTILGPLGAHRLTINDTSGTGAFGTVSLNGGPPVNFTSGDTDLKVTDGFGRDIYIDTTNITPGFSGDIDIQSDGSLSIDNGTTSTPIDFNNEQAIVHSITGHVTHLDGSQIRVTGTEHVEYVGSSDIFTTLVELRDDLRNTRGMDEKRITEAYGRRLSDIERASEHVLAHVGEQSSELASIEQLKTRQSDFVLSVKENLSELESADMTEVIVSMQNQQTLLQFSFAAYSIAHNNSILNFLG